MFGDSCHSLYHSDDPGTCTGALVCLCVLYCHYSSKSWHCHLRFEQMHQQEHLNAILVWQHCFIFTLASSVCLQFWCILAVVLICCFTISQDHSFWMLMLCFELNVSHRQCAQRFLQVLWIQQLMLDKIQRTGVCFVDRMSYTFYAPRLSMLCDKVHQSLSCHQQPVLKGVLRYAFLWPSYALSRLSSE